MTNGPVTASDVQWAVNELVERQERPTAVRVRELLGRGSFTTISKHLKRLKGDGGPQPPMPEPLQAAVAALHQRVQEQADEEVARVEAEAARRIETAERESTEAVRAAEGRAAVAEARLEEVRRQLAGAEGQAERLQDELTRRERLSEEVQAELGRTQGQLAERDRSIAGLERELAAGEERLKEQALEHAEALARLRAEHLAEEQRWQSFAETQLNALYKRMDAERLAARERETERQQSLQEAATSIALLKNELSRIRREAATAQGRHRHRWRTAPNRTRGARLASADLVAALEALERRVAGLHISPADPLSRGRKG